MREEILYTDSTPVKDLTVGELKDILTECMLMAPSFRMHTSCIGQEYKGTWETKDGTIF